MASTKKTVTTAKKAAPNNKKSTVKSAGKTASTKKTAAAASKTTAKLKPTAKKATTKTTPQKKISPKTTPSKSKSSPATTKSKLKLAIPKVLAKKPAAKTANKPVAKKLSKSAAVTKVNKAAVVKKVSKLPAVKKVSKLPAATKINKISTKTPSKNAKIVKAPTVKPKLTPEIVKVKEIVKPAPKTAVKISISKETTKVNVPNSVVNATASATNNKLTQAPVTVAEPPKKFKTIEKTEYNKGHSMSETLIEPVNYPETIVDKQSYMIAGISGLMPYKPVEGESYMSEAQTKHFRFILETMRRQLMEDVDRTVNDMRGSDKNLSDFTDRATNEEEMFFMLRTRTREGKLLKKIEEALDRVEHHDYGFCDNCGIEIGIRRLEARPTATLCIDCKTLDEIREKQRGS